MEQVYLDNASTTRVCDQAVEAAVEAMRNGYGNPSSLHGMGARAARALSSARDAVAALLGCMSESVCFTGGGSEANNLALLGGAQAHVRRGRRMVTTAIEHSSVLAVAARLEEAGWEVVRVPPDRTGRVDAAELADAVTSKTALVSMMFVNNETGTIQPVEEAAALIRARCPRTLIHCDGVQAFGKLPLRVSSTEIDLLSVSGHKICAPKGVGALYVRRGARVRPVIYGGGQEHGLRAGTEGLPMIAAFGAACDRINGQVIENRRRMDLRRNDLLRLLLEIPGVCINSPADATPYIISISVPGYRSETLLHFLEGQGVYVSSGSACSKGAVSPVLSAMGLAPAVVDGALRISLIYDTTRSDLECLARALRAGIEQVAHS